MSGLAGMLRDAGLDPVQVDALCRTALEEDVDDGQDITTVATVPATQRATLDLVSRASGVVAGVPVAALVFTLIDDAADITIEFRAHDGDVVTPGASIMVIEGPTHVLLTAERTALNFLGHLSGIATLTATWVDAIAGTGAAIRDTRKTTPGLRSLEKYAVRCGGGVNHRMSLSDAALVKDNHVVAAGGVRAAFDQVRERFPGVDVEVEVDSLPQFAEALDAGADVILLDNFSLEQMREAVAQNAGRATLEASGGLTLERAREVAETGVRYLAVGALTHSAPVLDIGADLTWEEHHAPRD